MTPPDMYDDSNNPLWLVNGEWAHSDPNPAPTYGFDTSPYQNYLQTTDGSGNIFDAGYSAVGRQSVNPYFNTQNRDALRKLATSLGLSSTEADRQALAFAQSHLGSQGNIYSDASSPQVVADSIAKMLYGLVGKPYAGLSPEQTQSYIDQARGRQDQNKAGDENDWKKDDIGSIIAFGPEWGQDIGEKNLEDPERAFLGAEDPMSSKAWGSLLGEEWDPTINMYGSPSSGSYDKAKAQGVDTGTVQFLQQVGDTTAGMIGGAAAGSGLQNAGLTAGEASALTGAAKGYAGGGSAEDIAKNLAISQGLNAVGGMTGGSDLGTQGGATDAQNLQGLEAGDQWQGNEQFQGYGEMQPGQDYSGLPGGSDLYASNDTGTMTDAAPDTGPVGSNGGSMFDEDGNFLSGDFGFDDPNADAYNDPYYDGSGFDTSGLGGGADGDPFAGIGGAGGLGGLSGILKSIFGAGGTSGAGGTAGGAGGLASLLGGGAGGNQNLMGLLGAILPASIGAMGAKNVANKYDQMAQRYEGFGEPYRQGLANLYANPDSFLGSKEVQTPVQMGTDALMRSLSVQGNPFGSGSALQQGQNYASNTLFSRLGEEKNRLGQLGGLVGYGQAAPGAASKAADAAGGQYTAAQYGTQKALAPTLAQQLGLV